ncbi:MAG: PEP-CTERM sorting domain-containing protein [Rhodocyclaceae bacterium]|nr:PEP-CTERM sorting domain-containing protein [Rhodocyclaceae bacterium]MBX3667795.1 PEP-CTERM sorting domain-containing protein [Rhodocyclaceae bacterium]
MKQTFRANALRALTLAAAAVAASSAHAVANFNNVGYVQYGDAQSYSLPFNVIDYCAGVNNGDCQFYVPSSPGQINDAIVIATSPAGIASNGAGFDDAYDTPNGPQNPGPGSETIRFQTSPSTARTDDGTIANNDENTWDARLDTLKTFLAGLAPVFYFNNNQTKSSGTSAETLAAWMQVRVIGPDGNPVQYTDASGTHDAIFDLTNHNSKYANVVEGGGGTIFGDVTTYTSTGAGPIAGDNDHTDYVLAGGALCRDQFKLLVSCSNPSAVEGPVDHNLGANQAVYAEIFPELNGVLAGLFARSALPNSDPDHVNLADYTMKVDLRLGCDSSITGNANIEAICMADPHWRALNNGYEQLFLSKAIFGGCTPEDTRPECHPVPEPGILSLLGLSVTGLALLRRRSKKA